MRDAPCKVSVIVPVYNVEKYLRKCLDSLVSQSMDGVEILVINDGSTDGSQLIIEEFQRDFSNRIFSFVKENGGLSDARNYGIDIAKGQYIGFVDSDDYVSRTMFEDMYNLAEKHQAEMVICNLLKVDEDGNTLQLLEQLPNMPEKMVLRDCISVFSDISYFACNKLFDRKLFDNYRFKKGIHFEDIELIPRLLLNCEIVAFTSEYHYNYLERANSISKSHTPKGLDILQAVISVEKDFEKSIFSKEKVALKNFQILEGVFTFLAYLAFVKNKETYYYMSEALDNFIKERSITLQELLKYRRFGKNYLLSLPFKKRVYYVFYFLGLKKALRIMMS